jgi:hypothetical protein
MLKCDPDKNLNMWMGRQVAYCVQAYNMPAMQHLYVCFSLTEVSNQSFQ